ncbi:Beta-1,3-N-acetylgalactosaminyltransferase 2 [Chamberlinius hualienensis]
MRILLLIISVIVLLLTLVITQIDWLSLIVIQNEGENSCDLLIGLLSARKNFEERLLLRNTWLTTVEEADLRVKYKFIVGKHSCVIPVEARKDIYSCDQMNITKTTEIQYSTLSTGKTTYGLVYSAFRFKVLQDILLSKLGILKSQLMRLNGSAVVSLTDSSLQEEVAKAYFTRENYQSTQEFAYRPIENLILSKGFEGILQVQLAVNVFAVEYLSTLNDGGGIIQFDMVEDAIGVVTKISSDPRHLSVSMGFQLYKSKSVDDEVERLKLKKNEEELDRRLSEEVQMYGDIQLVDVVDVYRNLPIKLLEFLVSSVDSYQFRYFLKVDDDTFVHLDRVIHQLQLSRSFEFTWFGSFRCNWVVQRFGKWKECAYSSAVYPCFACGSAYLLTQDIIRWLVNNKEILKTFQGEDVSMGIWLTALPIDIKQDDRWQCTDGCKETSFSKGQLSLKELENTWKCFKTYNEVCC